LEVWDRRYSEPGYAYGTEPNDFLVSVVDRLPRGRALCLGEGEGRNAVYLAQSGFEVTAVDASAVGLGKAEQLAERHGVEISTVVSDLADFTIEPGAWQAVVSIFCHLPPAVRSAVHPAVVNGLAPGGALVLEAFTPRQLELATGGPPSRELMMELGALQIEFAGLRLAVAREIEREVIEGRYHTGAAAVVQMLAFRDD
jgi:SAM-dependent methyltransferase